nr:unnamed protein product [Callosobruchus analis]
MNCSNFSPQMILFAKQLNKLAYIAYRKDQTNHSQQIPKK